VSELLGGGTQPVLWLKKNKAQLYEQYKSQCHDSQRKPIGKTKFYEGLQAHNFKEMEEMAGLCNICTENGAENFNRLDVLLASLEELWYKDNTTECPIPDILLRAKRYKGYLLSDFISNLEIHSECATHCMAWYLSPEPTCSSKEYP